MNTVLKLTRIVVVGGGAGGLELVTRLANTYRHNSQITITLVNNALTHVWKPHYHEIAAGTLANATDEVHYLSHAAQHNYNFCFGDMVGLDRAARTITVESTFSQHATESRILPYDVLVIAVGSVANDFNTPGVAEYCHSLDTLEQANRFHAALLQQLLILQNHPEKKLNIAIIGGGATGIELAAELHYALQLMASYGFHQFDPVRDANITLIEASPTLLRGVPGKLPQEVASHLTSLPVQLLCGQRVQQITATAVHTEQGEEIPYDLAIWVAGIKAPDWLKQLDGLETNAIAQLVVERSLQTSCDPQIFAFGDCTQCPSHDAGKFLAPRAQVAHQQALFLAKQIPRLLRQQPLQHFHLHDHGSLISLSSGKGIGQLMARLLGEFRVRGLVARLIYRVLYFSHRVNVQGLWPVLVQSFANAISKHTRARLKLH